MTMANLTPEARIAAVVERWATRNFPDAAWADREKQLQNLIDAIAAALTARTGEVERLRTAVTRSIGQAEMELRHFKENHPNAPGIACIEEHLDYLNEALDGD